MLQWKRVNIEAPPLGSPASGAPSLRISFSEESLILMVRIILAQAVVQVLSSVKGKIFLYVALEQTSLYEFTQCHYLL